MKGIFYGVGVGPGDPELLTLKALRIIRENGVIAVVGDDPRSSFAYNIAARACSEIKNKILVPLVMPMTKDRTVLETAHLTAAKTVEKYLDRGDNVVYITIGDPTVYCSFGYLKNIVEADGYMTETVSGVPSFCAAASRLGISLSEGDEPIRILPDFSEDEISFWKNGTSVIMKSGRKLEKLKKLAHDERLEIYAAKMCTNESERLFRSGSELPDSLGYMSIVILKAKQGLQRP